MKRSLKTKSGGSLGVTIGVFIFMWGATAAIAQSATVRVTANPPWTDTGISVTNGETVSVTASGTWTDYIYDGFFGPDGNPGIPYINDPFYYYANEGALIAYVGADPTQGHSDDSFFPQLTGYWNIGSSGSFASPTNGELWLGCNAGANIGTTFAAGSVTAQINWFDLVADYMNWRTNSGIDFAYTLEDGSITTPTKADLFWADGPNAADIVSSTPIYEETIPANLLLGTTNIVFVPDSYLANPPSGASYVVMVVDPDNISAYNVLALQIPPVPQVTFNRVVAGIGGDLLFSTNDGIDNPLCVSVDAGILATNSGPRTRVQGLVADGVTPLLFAVSLPIAANPAVDYQISFNVNGGGSLSDLDTNLYVLSGDEWVQSRDLSISGTNGYAYLGGLRAEDLTNAFDGTNQLTVQVNFTPIGSIAPVANANFYIRRPPVILVHGYSTDSNTWTSSFINQLQQSVPQDFIQPIEYGVLHYDIYNDYGNVTSTGEIESENTEGPLADLARSVDPILDAAFSQCTLNWAVTRYDVVAHSQGGVLVRMLCQTNLLGGSAFGASRPPVSASDFYRGRFRRVVTIGSPQNGSTLLRYWGDMRSNGCIVPILAGALIQPKFDPFGPQLASINSPTNPLDGRIKFNCIQCTLDSGQPQNTSTCFKLFSWTDLCEPESVGSICGYPVYPGSTKADLVTPIGSDGVVDFASEGGGTGTSNTDFTGASISHANYPRWFGLQDGQSETSAPEVAGAVNQLLDGPTSNFGPFQLPTTPQNQCVIDAVAPNSVLQKVIERVEPGAYVRTQSPGDSSQGGTNSCLTYEIQPTNGFGVNGDVTWYAEIYGASGITECFDGDQTNGVSLEVSGTNNVTATICVDPGAIGTVVLNAIYPSTTGTLVCADPVPVFSILPGNLTGIFVSPNSLSPGIGESDPLEIWGTYDTGISALLYAPPGPNLTWASSNPQVYEVSTNGVGSALTNGTAMVSANYLGYTGFANVTVNPPGYVLIATEPQNQIDVQGQAATLSVLVSGAGPFYYQWYFDGSPVSGATNSDLITSNFLATDSGSYYAIVSNAESSATSTVANLTVALPLIIRQPVNQTTAQGGTIVFSSSAVGASPLAYQWLCNGTNIPGATSSNLLLNDVTLEKAGAYQLEVTNIYGAIASATANLFVAWAAPGVRFSSLYSFGTVTDPAGDLLDGSYPAAGLAQAADGKFYGTTSSGGANGGQNGYGYGTIFDITTNGVFKSLYSFGSVQDSNGDPLDGADPVAGLVRGIDGNLYGMTSGGGTNSFGTIFRIGTNGAFTSVYSFGTVLDYDGNPLDGANPQGLALGADGRFYGTTFEGGANGLGTVFRIDTNGALTSLYSFGATQDEDGNWVDGANPESGLVLGADGNFYGTTLGGGANSWGTIFRISTNGTFISLYSFDAVQDDSGNPLDGGNPMAGLIQAPDGNLYGTTFNGGTNAIGTVFRITTNGALTSLYSFGTVQDANGNPLDGAYPEAGLAQIGNGTFYGSTSQGGESGGTLFQMTTNGAFTTLYWFSGGNDGAGPIGDLAEGKDGAFYGMTTNGGTNGFGSIFRFGVLPPPAPSFQFIEQSNGRVTFAWATVPGKAYQVQWATNLNQTIWNNLGTPISTNAPTLQISDVLGNGQKFYRVLASP